MTAHVGRIANIIIIASNAMNELPNSTNPASTPEIRMISRGKYTFEIKCAFPTKLVEERVSEEAKWPQGNKPAYTNTGQGTCPEGMSNR